MAGYYSARGWIIPPLPWPTFAPPLSELSGFIIKRRFVLLFAYDAHVEFKPAWMIPLCAMLRDIQKVAPRTRFYEIIECETGLLDVLFMSPVPTEEAVWKAVMEATERCAMRAMTR